MAILSASQLSFSYGDLQVLSGVNLEVGERGRIGIVGPNGSGKTTLLRILVGDLEPDAGTLARSRGLRIGYVPQEPGLPGGTLLRDEVMRAFDDLRSLEEAMAACASEMEAPDEKARSRAGARYSALTQEYESLGGYDYQNRMERVVAGVGLTSDDLKSPASAVSGGERTRASLARALLVEPDLLALDEPTNYLDFQGLGWLETFLGRFSKAFILVSHDRNFLEQLVTEIWEVDREHVQRYRGGYTAYVALKAERRERQRREFERQREHILKEEDFIRRYHAGQRAREARGRAKKLGRLERVEALEKDQSIHIGGAPASRAGQVVLGTRGLRVGFHDGGRDIELLSVPDLTLERGERVAVVGVNGAGKTTLLQTLLGLTPPISGAVATGHNVEVGYVTQGSDDLPDDLSVLEALLEVRNLPIKEARHYLARFLFTGDDVFNPVATCSGGERTRLALACVLATRPNVLVLDEPTTHLDIDSQEALVGALLGYNGALLFSSHDRHLISVLARRLWVVEEGTVHPFDGSFEEWMKTRREEPRPPPRPKKPRPRPQATPARKSSSKAMTRELERSIAGLEAKLAEIEAELQKATRQRDLERIAALGIEHQEVQEQFDRVWAQWEQRLEREAAESGDK